METLLNSYIQEIDYALSTCNTCPLTYLKPNANAIETPPKNTAANKEKIFDHI